MREGNEGGLVRDAHTLSLSLSLDYSQWSWYETGSAYEGAGHYNDGIGGQCQEGLWWRHLQ